jgi:hypothetical protein
MGLKVVVVEESSGDIVVVVVGLHAGGKTGRGGEVVGVVKSLGDGVG